MNLTTDMCTVLLTYGGLAHKASVRVRRYWGAYLLGIIRLLFYVESVNVPAILPFVLLAVLHNAAEFILSQENRLT